MKNVICFDASGAPELTEGQHYTATQCDQYPDSYQIEEVPCDPVDGWPTSYKKVRFLPTSYIDETELIKEREPALA